VHPLEGCSGILFHYPAGEYQLELSDDDAKKRVFEEEKKEIDKNDKGDWPLLQKSTKKIIENSNGASVREAHQDLSPMRGSNPQP
jgi:hypothetical protein